jgi:hypothetical protein
MGSMWFNAGLRFSFQGLGFNGFKEDL